MRSNFFNRKAPLTRDVSERVPDKILIFAFLLNFFSAFRRSAGTPYEVFFAFQRSAGTLYEVFSRSGVPPEHLMEFFLHSGVPPERPMIFIRVPAFRRFRNPIFFRALRSAGSGTGGTRFRNAFHRFRFFHIHVIFQVTYFFQVVTNLLFNFRTTVESYLQTLLGG